MDAQSRTRPDPQATMWLVARGLLAVALLAGFYLLGLAIAAALLWIPYAELRYLHRVDPRPALLCLAAAATILWALIPRRAEFRAPGPRLDAASDPRLFALIREVAAATGEREPDDVYLVPDMNAWVTQVHGVAGVGSRRVMGIGLPLLQTLSVDELKGVIAHEFGHYSGGDVKLGPWLYRTRSAIGRTLEGMGESVLRAPFHWYGRLFLRLTHAISRRQEFVADAVAAHVAGAPAQASALRRVSVAAPAFAGYMHTEVVPVVRSGFLPPIVEGFTVFNAAPRVVAKLAEIGRQAEAAGRADAFDTHPTLSERLDALGENRDGGPIEGLPAVSLLDDIPRSTRTLLEFAWGAEPVARLKPIEWDAVGDLVYAPGWKALATQCDGWLAQFTAETIPHSREELTRVAAGVVKRTEIIPIEEKTGRAQVALGAGLARALLDLGFRVESLPGYSAELVRGADRVDPFDVVGRLTAGTLLREDWAAACARLGLTGVRLGGQQPAVAV